MSERLRETTFRNGKAGKNLLSPKVVSPVKTAETSSPGTPVAGWRGWGVARQRNVLHPNRLQRFDLPAKCPFFMAGWRAGCRAWVLAGGVGRGRTDQESGIRSQGSGVRTQEPGIRSQGSDSFSARIFFLRDERIRESPQSALHQRLASRLSGFVQRANIFRGVSAYA
jgi:hypothetical protein